MGVRARANRGRDAVGALVEKGSTRSALIIMKPGLEPLWESDR
jgi:hypothetical protein